MAICFENIWFHFFENGPIELKPLSANLTKWSDTLKQFVGWFLYDRDLRHEKVKGIKRIN